MKDGRYDSFYLMHYKACILLQGPVRDGAVPSICYVAQVFSKHFFPTMNFFLQNIHSYLEDQPWPLWLDVVVELSHLALSISCSLNFYIYIIKYRSIRRQSMGVVGSFISNITQTSIRMARF